MFNYASFLTKAKLSAFRDEIFAKARLLDHQDNRSFTIADPRQEDASYTFTFSTIHTNVDRILTFMKVRRTEANVVDTDDGFIYAVLKKGMTSVPSSYDSLGRWEWSLNDETDIVSIWIHGTAEEFHFAR